MLDMTMQNFTDLSKTKNLTLSFDDTPCQKRLEDTTLSENCYIAQLGHDHEFFSSKESNTEIIIKDSFGKRYAGSLDIDTRLDLKDGSILGKPGICGVLLDKASGVLTLSDYSKITFSNISGLNFTVIDPNAPILEHAALKEFSEVIYYIVDEEHECVSLDVNIAAEKALNALQEADTRLKQDAELCKNISESLILKTQYEAAHISMDAYLTRSHAGKISQKRQVTLLDNITQFVEQFPNNMLQRPYFLQQPHII